MPILTDILLVALVLILFLAAFLLLRTLSFAGGQKAEAPIELLEVDSQAAAEHLAELIRCETVSMIAEDPERAKSFAQLRQVLQRTYPNAHKVMELQIFYEHALLYRWQGSNPELDPVVLMAHYDVVPVSQESLQNWEQPPFSGEIADGWIWGRGTLDIKSQITAIFEAAEEMIMLGYQPQRTFYLAFGHDEEIGGTGQKAFVEYFKKNNIHPGMVLDEGGSIFDGIVPGIDVPVAMIGTAEKGFVVVELKVEGTPGHSALPPRETPIGILARAVAFLEHDQMPAHPEKIIPFFKGVGGALPFSLQFAMANLWLTRAAVQKRLLSSPATAASIRTTTAPTIFHSGIRENVLPDGASARINFRILPGDSIASVCEHVRKVVADERVQIAVLQDMFSEPTPVSPVDRPAYQQLARTIRQVFHNLPVAPFLVVGATDARQYRDICENVYRFTPFVATPDDMKRIHGNNERLSVDALAQMVQFYRQLIKNWAD